MYAKFLKIAVLCCLGLAAFAVNAADLNAGKARALACQGCHGVGGQSLSPMFPTLAGQTGVYIEGQLHKFKSGVRDSAIMKPIAEGLNDADIQNLAAYFAAQPGKAAGGDAALAKAGKDKTTMCQGCHGEKFAGNGQFPRLAGQQPSYLEKQLLEFKSGKRQAGPMNAFAKTLSAEDIKAMAAYLAGL